MPWRRWMFVPAAALNPEARRLRTLLLVCLLGWLTAACTTPQPDLKRIYGTQDPGQKRTPVIVIPGIMGSRLDGPAGEGNVWPGSLLDLVFGNQLAKLALPVGTFPPRKDSLQVRGLFDEILGKSFYAELVNTLEDSGGYDCEYTGNVTARTDCILFTWDWRRDLVEAAGQLESLIDRLRQLRNEPELRVDIVAHSAGGLITRYFLRYGGEDVLGQPWYFNNRGTSRAKKAILIGTPNFGSITALQEAMIGSPVGLTRIPPEVMATMPALYQLLPHPDRTWMIGVDGKRVERDLYEVETWKNYQWSVFDPEVRQRITAGQPSAEAAQAELARWEAYFAKGLKRGKQFHRALSTPQNRVPTQYVVFGGDCHLTPARCLIERVDGEVKIRLDPDNVVNRQPGVDYERLMLEPGDGSVTKASLLARDNLNMLSNSEGYFPIDYSVFICEHHTTLTSNMTFRDNLLNILLVSP